MTLRTTSRCIALALTAVTTGSLHAQISLQSAVNLALKNSPKVRAAQADLDKARAARGEAKDAYVPQISTQTGYGQYTGAPLNVPVIFRIDAQSLVFSFSQRDYIRSAQQGVEAAEHALKSTEIEIAEDTTNTYLGLDSALQRQAVLQQESGFADKLVTITGERITAGVDAKVELPKSRRTATQIRLQALQVADEIAGDREHLAQLTGLPATALATIPASVPVFDTPHTDNGNTVVADSEGIRAAYATAEAKRYIAFGDSRYLLRPQISLGANYSRVDASLSSYASYYPRFGGTPDAPNSNNSLGVGVQISIPLLDLAHRSKARQSAAEAARAFAVADQQRGVFREGRAKLQNSTAELALRSQLARDDQEIAHDQLEALQVQLDAAASTGATPANPKDQLNAQLQERQKYLDVLNADLQLQQTQVNLLRQTEGLGSWILGGPQGSAVVAPTVVTPSVPVAAPSTLPEAPPAGAPTH